MNYICNECKTRYGSGPGNDAPTGIKWSDGHTCDPVLVESETFDRPKPKDFTMKLEFNSNKPNKIIYDSRDVPVSKYNI